QAALICDRFLEKVAPLGVSNRETGGQRHAAAAAVVLVQPDDDAVAVFGPLDGLDHDVGLVDGNEGGHRRYVGASPSVGYWADDHLVVEVVGGGHRTVAPVVGVWEQ